MEPSRREPNTISEEIERSDSLPREKPTANSTGAAKKYTDVSEHFAKREEDVLGETFQENPE